MKNIIKASKKSVVFLNMAEAFFPVFVAIFYFICNCKFTGLIYPSDEFGYLSKMIFLSGNEIIYPSQWHFGYSLFLLPVAWLTKQQSQFWFNFVVYQSLIWCATFYLLRRFITFVKEDVPPLHRLGIMFFCAMYPSWCIMTGFAFATTVFVFLYMVIISFACRWDGKSFIEPVILASLTGILYWVHPLTLGIVVPLLILIVSNSRSSVKRLCLQLFIVLAVFGCFYILYKAIAVHIDKHISDAISYRFTYASHALQFKWRDIIVIILMFFSQLSAIVLSTLGFAFSVFFVTGQELINKFRKKTLNEFSHKSGIFLFCILSLMAISFISAAFFCAIGFGYAQEIYHWIYLRYAEMVILPLLAAGLLLTWKKRFFILPCFILLAPLIGLFSYINTIIDNPINLLSIVGKNIIIYSSLISLDTKEQIIVYIIATAVFMALMFIAAQLKYLKILFFTSIIAAYAVCIYNGIKWHNAGNDIRPLIYQKLLIDAEKNNVAKHLFWDSKGYRDKQHITYEQNQYAFARMAFWKAKWKIETTGNWLKHKKGILITDYPQELLHCNDLYIYKLPCEMDKYVVSTIDFSSFSQYKVSAFWDNNRLVTADNFLAQYIYRQNPYWYSDGINSIFFAADKNAKYLQLQTNGDCLADFYLNDHKLISLTSPLASWKIFDVTDLLTDCNKLESYPVYETDAKSNVCTEIIQAAVVSKRPIPPMCKFSPMSSPYKLSKKSEAAPQSAPTFITLDANEIQCGPAIPLPPGIWQIEYRGKNLPQGEFDFSYNFNGFEHCRQIKNVQFASDCAKYIFSHSQKDGTFEFRCKNPGSEKITIKQIMLTEVSKNDGADIAVNNMQEFTLDKNIYHQRIAFNLQQQTAVLSGFHSIEPTGRWAGKNCEVILPVKLASKEKLEVTFRGWPISPQQVMIVRSYQDKILKTIPLSEAGAYRITVSRKECKDNLLKLKLEFPKAHKPDNGDTRILSFFFYNIELSPEKTK